MSGFEKEIRDLITKYQNMELDLNKVNAEQAKKIILDINDLLKLGPKHNRMLLRHHILWSIDSNVVLFKGGGWNEIWRGNRV